jgi:uncharacterized OB-fold protein
MTPGTEPAGSEPVVKVPPESLVVLSADTWTMPFWEAAAEHRLVVPRCKTCGTFRLPPSPFCWNCRNQGVDWVEQPGRGTVYSFTVVWHPLLPDLADSVPYAPAVVSLPDAGGVRVVGAMVGVRPSEVHIGLEVELVWRDVRDGVTVPTWRPAVDAAAGRH